MLSNLSKDYVYTNVSPGEVIYKAAAKAIESGYTFMLFNDVVYAIAPDSTLIETTSGKKDIY